MPLFFVKTPSYCSRHKYPLGTYFSLKEETISKEKEKCNIQSSIPIFAT